MCELTAAALAADESAQAAHNVPAIRRVTCDYCHGSAELVGGNEIYPHRTDLFHLNFWLCRRCDAYVGCHRKARKNGKGGLGDGTVPKGKLANAALRRERKRAHAAFDPIWRSREMDRNAAYAWLAEQLGISRENCHIGMMNEDQCRAVVAICNAREK